VARGARGRQRPGGGRRREEKGGGKRKREKKERKKGRKREREKNERKKEKGESKRGKKGKGGTASAPIAAATAVGRPRACVIRALRETNGIAPALITEKAVVRDRRPLCGAGWGSDLVRVRVLSSDTNYSSV
jgi:hypothetical protein